MRELTEWLLSAQKQADFRKFPRAPPGTHGTGLASVATILLPYEPRGAESRVWAQVLSDMQAGKVTPFLCEVFITELYPVL